MRRLISMWWRHGGNRGFVGADMRVVDLLMLVVALVGVVSFDALPALVGVAYLAVRAGWVIAKARRQQMCGPAEER